MYKITLVKLNCYELFKLHKSILRAYNFKVNISANQNSTQNHLRILFIVSLTNLNSKPELKIQQQTTSPSCNREMQLEKFNLFNKINKCVLYYCDYNRESSQK